MKLLKYVNDSSRFIMKHILCEQRQQEIKQEVA